MLNWILALVSALLSILIYPKFHYVWLAPVALGPLLVAAARESSPWRRFAMGWVCGVVYWAGVCYWIQFVLAIHGGMGQSEGWAMLALFAAAKGIHMGVFAWLAGILMRRWWAIPSVAALWVALEATHGSLGFAWLALGNAGIDMSLPLRLAPITGVWGISFLFVMMGTALALAAMGRSRIELLWLLPVLFTLVLPPLPGAARGRETALLVQPNLSESEEWTSESFERMLDEQLTETLRGALADPRNPPSIIVWPEVPAPLYYDEDPRFRRYADRLAETTRAYFLVGVVGRTMDGAPTNSAELVAPDGVAVSRYDKVHLVPFGEYVPYPFGWLTRKISTEAGDFAAGSRMVVSPVGAPQIGAFICYESVFPGFVREFVDHGAEVLFNISNDGWFGRSAARLQHLEILRMRAAENRRWILRATNDGITAAIDSAGRLRAGLLSYTEATLPANFRYISEKTFYTRHGDWFAWFSAAIAVIGLAAARLGKTVPSLRSRLGLVIE
ncbi:MAG: apolipoprotein N-acyltransferase [Bryobacteraceae bacterium]